MSYNLFNLFQTLRTLMVLECNFLLREDLLDLMNSSWKTILSMKINQEKSSSTVAAVKIALEKVLEDLCFGLENTQEDQWIRKFRSIAKIQKTNFVVRDEAFLGQQLRESLAYLSMNMNDDKRVMLQFC